MKSALNILIILLILTFISGIVWVFYYPNKYKNVDVDSIIENNFKIYPNFYTSPDSFTDTNSLALPAMKFYTLGKYQLAMETFQKFEPQIEDDGYYNLYLGICYFKVGYTNIAIGHLYESAESFKMFNDKTTARWYLALALLKANRIPEAKVLFEQLFNQNTEYKKKSQDILKLLDAKFWKIF
jgi:tetratricopeptide (TPR) repeat protein